MLTNRPATESALKRKSSQALAWGTRDFIISHLARAALIDGLSRATAARTSRSDKASAAAADEIPANAQVAQNKQARFIASFACRRMADVCAQLMRLPQRQIMHRVFVERFDTQG